MDESPPSANPIWCVVANIAHEVHVGPGGAELQQGTKHFSPGTKVYCFPPQWGDGYERVRVLGRHRGSGRLVEMVTRWRYLTSWRAVLVYKPFVIEAMRGHWDASEGSRARAELVAGWGKAARACPHCAISHRFRDVSGLWIFRRWPALAYIEDFAARPIVVTVVSSVHDDAGQWLAGQRESFHAGVAAIAEVVRLAAGPVPEVADPVFEDGHLRALLALPAVAPRDDDVANLAVEPAALSLARRLGRTPVEYPPY